MDIDKSNIRKLDFSLLLIFQALLRSGKTTAVATELNLSQSAISHALTRLRSAFNDPLFIRRPDGVLPNSTALRLSPKIDQLLELARDVLNEPATFDPSKTERVFRVVTEDFIAALLSPLLERELSVAAPKARFSVRFAVDHEAMESLRSDVADCAIGRYVVLPDDCRSQHFSSENYAVVARRDTNKPSREIDLHDYIAARHVLVSFSGDFHGTVDNALLGLQKDRQVVATVPHFLTAMAMASSSDCLTTVPRRLAEYYGEAFNLSVHAPPFAMEKIALSVATHSRRMNDLGLAWFIGTLQRLWLSQKTAARL